MFVVFLLVNLVLPVCILASTSTPTPVPDSMLLPAVTTTPTAMPATTPVFVSSVQIRGLSVSDPCVTNPELVHLRNPHALIPQFMNTIMGVQLASRMTAPSLCSLGYSR